MRELLEVMKPKRQRFLTHIISTHDTPASGGGENSGGIRLSEIPDHTGYTDYAEQYELRNPDNDASYYLDRLFPHFNMVNGSNRYRIIKTRSSIIVKDGSLMKFRCSLTPVNARNLYLELYSCNYDCESWLIASKVVDSFQSDFNYSGK